MFQTRCKYSEHVVNVSTALYSQRVANSRKKIIRDKYNSPSETQGKEDSNANVKISPTIDISLNLPGIYHFVCQSVLYKHRASGRGRLKTIWAA